MSSDDNPKEVVRKVRTVRRVTTSSSRAMSLDAIIPADEGDVDAAAVLPSPFEPPREGSHDDGRDGGGHDESPGADVKDPTEAIPVIAAPTHGTKEEPTTAGRPAERVGATAPGPRPQPAASSTGLLRPSSPALTYAGVAGIMLGFVLLAVGWGGVADKADVAFQIPYLVSAAMTGLGAIVVGVTMVSVATRRRDTAQRQQQVEMLADALHGLAARRGE